MYRIYDVHNDYFTKKKFDFTRNNYVNKISTNNKFATVVWTSEMSPEKALSNLQKANSFINNHNNTFLAIEDLHFLSKQSIYEIINYHPYYCSMTWNFNNNLAGGALDTGDITAFGKDVIKLFENNNIIIDTAHLNEKSFMSFSSLTNKPILCSHTDSYEICNHKRNLKDYQIKIIVESRGLVCFALVSDFLTGKHKSVIDDYIKHIDYCVNKFGIDCFAIGTDFNGAKHLPKNIYNYSSLENILSSKLLKLGYSNNDIDKLFYKNAYNFFEK